MKIEGTIPTQLSRATSQSGAARGITDFAAALASASAPVSTPASPDFHAMTRRELADWMNDKIRSGEMSLDDSTAFLGMTLKIPIDANGVPTSLALDDSERVDFVRLAQNGMSFAAGQGDDAMLARLAKAITIMQSCQGGASSRLSLNA